LLLSAAHVKRCRSSLLGYLVCATVTLLAPRAGLAAASSNSPPFTLTRDGAQWWLRSPDGQPFFSVGVCLVTRGASRENFSPINPGYAAWQHYRSDAAWADATLKRLREWGFETIGAWSHHSNLIASPHMLRGLTPVLHVGSTAGAPWWDMWDPKIIQRMDDVARGQILAVRDDPRLIGYYTDNEMGWWNAMLFRMTLDQPPTSGQRQRLLRLLRETYGNDWKKLLADFEPEGAVSFDGLAQRGQLWLRPGGTGIIVMRRFLALAAERYYQLANDIIRKYDRRALILGDRYQSFYYPEVAHAAAPYVDAISCNLNASWHDGSFVRFQLETLHALTGKPVFVSEFYLSATANRSGNKNDHGIFPVVSTQRERAAGIMTTLNALVRLPYVVGADWFQYFDEPTHGRDDGENFNFGLVDIHDKPYVEVTRAFTRADLTKQKLRGRPTRPGVSVGVPRAPRDPFANFTPGHALRNWDRERGFVKPTSEFAIADLYVCWSAEALYVGLFAQDMVEEAYYRDKVVPEVDRSVWTVRAGEGQPVTARIGAGLKPIVSDPGLRIENLSGVNLNVRNIAILELPARKLGLSRLHRGDTIQLKSILQTHGKTYSVEWEGSFRLK
jgi:hypothetical protein